MLAAIGGGFFQNSAQDTMVGRFICRLVGYASSNSTSPDWRKGQAHYTFTAGSAVRSRGGGFLGRNVP